MVTFEVPKENVKGWKGTAAPATKKSGARRPVHKKR